MDVLHEHLDPVTLGVPAALALLGLVARFLTPRGAAAGLLVGVLVCGAGAAEAAMLASFFLAGSLLTKYRARDKAANTPGAVVAGAAQPGTPEASPAAAKGATKGALRRRASTPDAGASGAAAAAAAAARTAPVAGADTATATAPVAAPAAAAAEASRGRDEWQVLATGGVPALLCASRFLGVGDAAWRAAYLAYMATNAGDTFASELGMLARRPPVSVLTLQPVPTGQDGGISFAGTVASLVGGAMVGACGGSLTSTLHGVLWGCLGSFLDSIGGAVLQGPIEASRRRPTHWKRLNNAVNVLSASATAALAVAALRAPLLLPPLVLCAGVVVLVTAPVGAFGARKLLHVGTSALVLLHAHQRGLVAAVAAATLAAVLPLRRVLGRFEEGGRLAPGVPTYALSVGAVAALRLPPFYVLGPMFFADPAAALVGSSVCSPRLLGTRKTAAGTAAFFAAALLWYTAAGPALVAWMGADEEGAACWRQAAPARNAALIAAALALLELASGAWDNICLVVAMACAAHMAA